MTHRVRVGSVHIIETLPPGELRTGERLFEELEPLALAVKPAMATHLWREQTRERFLDRLSYIFENVQRSGRAPLVHIEAHGSPEGLQMASGEYVTWADLKPQFTAFRWVMKRYFEERCTDEAPAERELRAEAELTKMGASPGQVTAASALFGGYIRDHRSRFDEIKTNFFFSDLYPDHLDRFAVTFSECFSSSDP